MTILRVLLLVVPISICGANLVDNTYSVLRTNLQNFPDETRLSPCSDFYKFACNNRNALDTDGSSASYLDIAKQKITSSLIQTLNDNSSIHSGYDEAWTNARKFYFSCLQSRPDGAIPELKKVLEKISQFPIINEPWSQRNFNWIEVVADLRRYGVQAIIQETIAPHWKDSQIPKIYLTAPKFEFVHKEDLLGTSRNHDEFVFFYKRYIKLLMHKLGLQIRRAREVSERIVEFETRLAEIVPDESEVTPPEPISLETLTSQQSEIDWTKYLTNVLDRPLNLTSPQIIVNDEYYRKLVPLIAQTDRRIIAQYLLFKFMFKFKAAIDDEHNEQQCLQDTVKKMASTVGKVYVKAHFSEENKQIVNEILNDVQTAFAEILNESGWLDHSTKMSALEKLNATRSIVGYSEELFQHRSGEESVQISSNYYENCLNLAIYATQREHDQLRKGLHPWIPSPVDSNAYYKVTRNTIFIPAGLLVPPVFDKSYPKFRNYGVLGSIIGHEMTHGFDFEGKNYNAQGSVENWWTTKSLIAYYSHVECILSQHRNISASQGFGQFGSVSENVADSAGVQVAFRAYLDWTRRNPGLLPREADNTSERSMTNNQGFFLNFAKFWCTDDGDNTTSRSHSTNKYRVFNSMASLPAFADAFNCQPGSTMNPSRRCKLW